MTSDCEWMGGVLSSNRRLNELIEILRREAPQDSPIYMVGGAVRDLLRKQPVHDLDLIVMGEIRSFARRVANIIHGGFYMLDEKRETARVIDHSAEAGTVFIDFCALRAGSLEEDLRERDFSINAMAFDLRAPDQLLDPTGGRADLHGRLLRAPSDQAFQRDPVRVLRGARLSLYLGFELEPRTYEWMRQAARLLPSVSPERQRDELFRMLESGKTPGMVRLLDRLGALDPLLPGLSELKGVSQSPPHILDAWEHTLRVMERLEDLWAVLVDGKPATSSKDAYVHAAADRLGVHQDRLAEHFSEQLNPNRSLRALVFLAALVHDTGKALTRSVDPHGRIRFFNHETTGSNLAARLGRNLALSQVEIYRLTRIVSGHMRIHQMTFPGQSASRRAIYRYFRDTGNAGIDILLLSLADTLGTYGDTLPLADWKAELELAKTLLEAWFEQPATAVRPPRLLSGAEIIAELSLPPGPAIGLLLAAIEEAQAAGEITTRQQALDFLHTHSGQILGGHPSDRAE